MRISHGKKIKVTLCIILVNQLEVQRKDLEQTLKSELKIYEDEAILEESQLAVIDKELEVKNLELRGLNVKIADLKRQLKVVRKESIIESEQHIKKASKKEVYKMKPKMSQKRTIITKNSSFAKNKKMLTKVNSQRQMKPKKTIEKHEKGISPEDSPW
jgi:hypothetical protein